MNQNTHPDNDHEAWIDKQINKLADRYAACDQQSSDLNKERKEIRDDAEKLGISSRAFQHAVSMVKNMSEGERRDYQVGMNRTLKAIGERQGDLFPQHAEKARKREERKAAEAANEPRSQQELDALTDGNPRSNPATGGAAAVQAVTDAEQAEGDTLLAGKSAAWRAGFNGHEAGGERKANPFLEGGAEAREWLSGFAAAEERAFNAAAPDVPPAPPVDATDGGTFNDGVGKATPAKKPAKKSQSEKAAEKRKEAGLA